MESGFELGCCAVALCHIHKTLYTFKETLTALDAGRRPRSCCAVITHKEDVYAENVCAVFFYNVVGVNDVTLGFTHLFAVRTEDKPLRGTFRIRFIMRNDADIIKEMMPETRIDHMTGNVFHTTVIPVNRHPIVEFIHISKAFVIVWVNVS